MAERTIHDIFDDDDIDIIKDVFYTCEDSSFFACDIACVLFENHLKELSLSEFLLVLNILMNNPLHTSIMKSKITAAKEKKRKEITL